MNILTDNCKEFGNICFKGALEEYGIRQVVVPLYRAQSDPVECSNRVLKSMIVIVVDNDSHTRSLLKASRPEDKYSK